MNNWKTTPDAGGPPAWHFKSYMPLSFCALSCDSSVFFQFWWLGSPDHLIHQNFLTVVSLDKQRLLGVANVG